MLRDLIEQHHEELTNARIGLAWCLSWKPDVDGRWTLGKCRRATDLDRELVALDFVILLNPHWWQHADVTDAQRLALLDHEISHAAVKVDEDGEPMCDDRGRVVYRTRKHDIEEFSGVIRRHGVYKRDLEDFAAAIKAAPKQAKLPIVEIDEHVSDLAAHLLRPKEGEGSVTFSMPGSGLDPVELKYRDT